MKFKFWVMLTKSYFIVDLILVIIIICLLSFVSFGIYKNYLNEFKLRKCLWEVNKYYENIDQKLIITESIKIIFNEIFIHLHSEHMPDINVIMDGIKNQEKTLPNGMNILIKKVDLPTKNCHHMLKLLDQFTEIRILTI